MPLSNSAVCLLQFSKQQLPQSQSHPCYSLCRSQSKAPSLAPCFTSFDRGWWGTREGSHRVFGLAQVDDHATLLLSDMFGWDIWYRLGENKIQSPAFSSRHASPKALESKTWWFSATPVLRLISGPTGSLWLPTATETAPLSFRTGTKGTHTTKISELAIWRGQNGKSYIKVVSARCFVSIYIYNLKVSEYSLVYCVSLPDANVGDTYDPLSW